jgi:hypothetical protein
MTEPPEKEENASGEANQKSKRPSGRWNPFVSLRMTISPEQRMALLNMPMPLLPPEDFLSAEERKKLARARRGPIIIRLVVVFGIAALAILVGWWLWPSATHRDAQPKAVSPHAASTPSASPAVAAPPVVTLTQPTAERIPEAKPASSSSGEPIDRVLPKTNVTAKTMKSEAGHIAPIPAGTRPMVPPKAEPSPGGFFNEIPARPTD